VKTEVKRAATYNLEEDVEASSGNNVHSETNNKRALFDSDSESGSPPGASRRPVKRIINCENTVAITPQKRHSTFEEVEQQPASGDREKCNLQPAAASGRSKREQK